MGTTMTARVRTRCHRTPGRERPHFAAGGSANRGKGEGSLTPHLHHLPRPTLGPAGGKTRRPFIERPTLNWLRPRYLRRAE